MIANTAVNRDAPTGGFAACWGARYLRRWASLSAQDVPTIGVQRVKEEQHE